MSERKLYQVNLNGTSPVFAFRRCDQNPEFEDACDYCLDAPMWYPAGSTRLLVPDGPYMATIATQVWRDGA